MALRWSDRVVEANFCAVRGYLNRMSQTWSVPFQPIVAARRRVSRSAGRDLSSISPAPGAAPKRARLTDRSTVRTFDEIRAQRDRFGILVDHRGVPATLGDVERRGAGSSGGVTGLRGSRPVSVPATITCASTSLRRAQSRASRPATGPCPGEVAVAMTGPSSPSRTPSRRFAGAETGPRSSFRTGTRLRRTARQFPASLPSRRNSRLRPPARNGEPSGKTDRSSSLFPSLHRSHVRIA